MKNFDFKKLLPHLVAIIFFIFITYIYFSPMLAGKDLPQMDITHSIGYAHELNTYHETTGEYSQWTNSQFGGMPAYNVGPYGSMNNVFYYLHSGLLLNMPGLTVGIVFMYLLGFYVLLTSLRINPWLSIVGAIAFAFASYNFIIIEVGHVNKAYAIAFMAPVLAGILLTYRGKFILGGILTTIALGLEIAIPHPQITYYLMMIVMVFLIVQFIYTIKEKSWNKFIKASAVLGIASILAVLPSATMLYTNYELGKESTRGESELVAKNQVKKSSGLDHDYAFQWSYGKAESFTVLIPNFYGGGSSTKLDENSNIYKALEQQNQGNKDNLAYFSQFCYWGDMPFTNGTVYIGAIVCLLFMLGLFIVKGPEKWWLLAITLLSFFLSWGKNLAWFNDFFFYYFPMYNKFRAVSSALVIAGVTMPLLAFLTLRTIFDEKIVKKDLIKPLKISLIIVGGLTLIFALIPGMFFTYTANNDAQLTQQGIPDLLMNAIRADRESLLRTDAFRSLVFVLLSGGLLWVYLKEKIKMNYVIAILGLLILVDMWPIAKRSLNDSDFVSKSIVKNKFTPSTANTEILKDKDPNYRVFNLSNPFQEVNTSYFHKSIGGYHAVKLRKYQEFIDTCLYKDLSLINSVLSNKPTDSSVSACLKKIPALNMLNAKYIIYNPDAPPLANRNALGNAWFVKNYQIVGTPNEELHYVNGINPAQTAIIGKQFESLLGTFKNSDDSLASITFESYKPNNLVYNTKSSKEQLAVFSEIYYPHGWNAYVDGKLTPHFRANFILRAMMVPAGNHKIEFKFEPKEFKAAQSTAFASSIIVVIIVLGGLFFELWKKLRPSGTK
ncbi:MAG: YfhO family protein [Bacteroidetes bacterium]|nr:YfhO family protein [Bacteroidota bacterium]